MQKLNPGKLLPWFVFSYVFYAIMIVPYRLFELHYRLNWSFDKYLWTFLGVFTGFIMIVLVFYGRMRQESAPMFVLIVCIYGGAKEGLIQVTSPAVGFFLLVVDACMPGLLLACFLGQRGPSTKDARNNKDLRPPAPTTIDNVVRGTIAQGMAWFSLPIASPIFLRQGLTATYVPTSGLYIAFALMLIGAVATFVVDFAIIRRKSQRHAGPLSAIGTWGGLIVAFVLMGITPPTLGGYVTAEILFGASAWFTISSGFESWSRFLARTTDPARILVPVIAIMMAAGVAFGTALSFMFSLSFFSWLYNATGIGEFWMSAISVAGCAAAVALLSGELGCFPDMLAYKVKVKKRGPRMSRVVYWGTGIASLVLLGFTVAGTIPLYTSPLAEAEEPLGQSRISLPPAYSGWQTLYNATFSILQSNLRFAPGTNQLIAIPGGYFDTGWYWDTAFISMIWRLTNPAVATRILTSYMSGAINPNGMVSHMYDPASKSGQTQPPLFAWAAWDLYASTGDATVLHTLYPLLCREFNYWQGARLTGDGLFRWWYRDESGMDNIPSFPYDPTTTGAFDLSAWIAFETECLGRIAGVLGHPDDVTRYANTHATIIAAIQAKCWDPATGFFYNVDETTGQQIRVKTIAAAIALLAGIATPAQADIIVNKHLLNASEFWTPYPLPSTAIDEPEFQQVYWKGPTWVNMNYCAIRGLLRYNYTSAARDLANRTIDMVEKVYADRGTLYELYNSITGHVTDVYNPGGGMPEGTLVGWTGLVTNMVREIIAGVSWNRTGAALAVDVRPLLLDSWADQQVGIADTSISASLLLHSNQTVSISIEVPASLTDLHLVPVGGGAEVPVVTHVNGQKIQINATITNQNAYRLVFG